MFEQFTKESQLEDIKSLRKVLSSFFIQFIVGYVSPIRQKE